MTALSMTVGWVLLWGCLLWMCVTGNPAPDAQAPTLIQLAGTFGGFALFVFGFYRDAHITSDDHANDLDL